MFKRTGFLKSASCFLAFALMFVFACAPRGRTDTSTEDTAESASLVAAGGMLAKHDGTLYSIIDLVKFSRIYATDLNTWETLPLCGKPDCEHDDGSCNAYCGHGECLVYSNGRLFWIDNQITSYKLYSIALDGTDRRLEKTLKKEYEIMLGRSFMGFYKGKLYRCGVGGGVLGAEIYEGMLLYSQELGKDAEPEEILRLNDAGDFVARMHENMLYVAAFNYDDSVSADTIRLYSYDMDSRSLSELYSGDFDGMGALDMIVKDDALVFHCGSMRIISYSLKDGSMTDLYTTADDYSVGIVSDGYGFVATSMKDYCCVDAEGRIVSSGSFTDAGLPEETGKTQIGSADDVFFFLLETMYNTAQNHVYLVSIDPKTGEAKVLVEAEQHYANDLSTIIIE